MLQGGHNRSCNHLGLKNQRVKFINNLTLNGPPIGYWIDHANLMVLRHSDPAQEPELLLMKFITHMCHEQNCQCPVLSQLNTDITSRFTRALLHEYHQ